ncbi:hypothetical protein WEI85_00550 [Actinomycetes bacterium KLBMP 9797]
MTATASVRLTHGPMDGRDLVADSLQSFYADIKAAIALTDFAEDEIAQAMARHPVHADRIWHSFDLLKPTLERLDHEVVYRAHCAELLDRVAHNHDTRPATSAECCVALIRVSLTAPLKTAAFGLYLRLWADANFSDLGLGETRQHYEALVGSQIDGHELWLRHRMRQDWRTLPTDIQHVRLCPHTRRAQA